MIDAATLTGAMAVAIGGAASGVYSTNEKYWDLMNRASFNTGDRVWRMPLWNYYLEKMKSKNKDKTSNVGYMKPLNGTPGFENLIEALNYLNNYFDFHVCLSIHPSVVPVPSGQKLTSILASVSQNVTNRSCLVCIKSEKCASWVTLTPQWDRCRRGEAEVRILDFKTTWSEFQKPSQTAPISYIRS